MRVIVVGAGIVGAACARALASAGFDITVLERGACWWHLVELRRQPSGVG